MTLHRKLFFLLLTFVIAALWGCGGKKAPDTGIAYLFPQLQSASVTSIFVTSSEGESRMVLGDEGWVVATPVEFAADPRVIDVFLQTLLDAEEGKPMDVAEKDYAQLHINDDGGVHVDIGLADGQTIRAVFGKVDIPRNSEEGVMMGAGAVARRYVRVKGEQDRIYLAPISLVDLSSFPSLWTDTAFPRVALVKRMQLLLNGNTRVDANRVQPFGAFTDQDQTLPASFRCFEEFLASGRCLQVANKSTKLSSFGDTDQLSLIVDDFLGTRYHFHFGKMVMPTGMEIERAALNADFLNDGIAQQKIPFSVEVNELTHVNTESLIGSVVKTDNLTLAQRYRDRVAFLNVESFMCLQQLATEANQ